MRTPRLVRGRWVITGAGADEPVLADAAVVVVGDRVHATGPWGRLREEYPDAEVLGSADAAVLPGFVNAHHHSNGVTHLQQGVADDLLELWLLDLRRRRRTDPYLDTLLSAARLLRTGVTSTVEVRSLRGSAAVGADQAVQALRAYDEAGLRVAFAPGISDQSHLVWGGDASHDERFLKSLPDEARLAAAALLPSRDDMDVEEYFALIDDLWRRYLDHPRIDIWFGPPGPQWVSDAFMQRIAEKAAAYGTGVQTHVAESFYEKLHGPKFHGRPILQHLHKLGVLSPRFSIAHGVWLTDAEIAVLSETGAGVSHNPGSNLRLRAGIAPLEALLSADVAVALGMDGTTLNDDEDMFTELRLALRLHRAPQLGACPPSPCDILRIATAGGAKLLGKETSLGRLAPGYAADLVVVDLARLSWPWVAPEMDPRDLVVARARAGDVRTVLVAGEVVLEDGQPTRFDAEAAGRELAARLAAEPYPADMADRIALLRPHLERHYGAWRPRRLEPYVTYNSRR